MNNKLLLLVDATNDEIQHFNKRLLEKEGFAVEIVMTLAGAREFIERKNPDIIILDIAVPDGDGLDFLCELRQSSNIPVLILTEFGEEDDIIKGYESGCNDYLLKPYTSFGVLLARIKYLLKSAEQVPERITRGKLSLDIISGQAFLSEHDLLLSQKEFSLLLLLIQNEGRIISAERIYIKIWGKLLSGDKNALQVTVSRLRRKIEPAGFLVSMTRNKGYSFKKIDGNSDAP